MRHIITVTHGIAEARASPFTLHPHIKAIGTADPDTAVIVLDKAAQSLPTQAAEIAS
jgi:hypothetical protein